MNQCATGLTLDLWHYRVSLRCPAPVRRREGLVCQWRTDSGHECWSEMAPLPGFSREDLATCELASRQLLDLLPVEQALEQRHTAKLPAAARFAFEAGRWQLLGGPPEPPRLEPCRLLGAEALAAGECPERAAALKVKVGRAAPERERALLLALLHKLPPGAQLRLDANRSLTAAQVRTLTHGLPPSQVEFLEEPLLPGSRYDDWEEISTIPFAWDEMLLQAPEPDLRTPGLGALVVKPMLLGLEPARAWVEKARAAGVKVILSGAFESNLSLDLYAALAHEWELEGPHGLDTFGPWPEALIRPLISQPDCQRPIRNLEQLEHRGRWAS